MKVNIDRDGCIECGACESSCDTVFHLPDGDKAVIVEKYRMEGKPDAGDVPTEFESCAQEAADSCPVSVISTEKSKVT
jgi:ferredoxin